MAKDKLENILSFKEFSELPTHTKQTKRTEVGGDVLNENIYDKIRDASKSDKDYTELLDKFKKYIINTCQNNNIKNIKFDGSLVTFEINKREFKLNKDGEIILYSTKFERYKDDKNKTRSRPTGKEEVKVKLSAEDGKELFAELKKCS